MHLTVTSNSLASHCQYTRVKHDLYECNEAYIYCTKRVNDLGQSQIIKPSSKCVLYKQEKHRVCSGKE